MKFNSDTRVIANHATHSGANYNGNKTSSNCNSKKVARGSYGNMALKLIMNKNSSYLNKFSDVDVPIFIGDKCKLPDAIKIFFGWSLGINLQDMAQFLNVEEYVVRYLYTVCTQHAKQYIWSHISEWKIGGPDVIVLIDTYPDGCNKFNYEVNTESVPVLCIAEAKNVPPKYWFEILDSEDSETMNDYIVHVVKTIVKPGSILVSDSLNVLRNLRDLFPVIMNIDDLMRHNNEHQNLLDNLETIWEPALLICENGSYHSDARNYYTSCLWNQKFGNDGLGVLLDQF